MTSWPRKLPEREPEIKGTFRVALLGNSGAGKTCLLANVADGSFQDVLPPTIGIDFRCRTFSVGAGGKKDLYKLQIWDTAGMKEFRTISLSYISSECLLVVFDVTSRESFEDAISHWVPSIARKCTTRKLVMLVGTKCDLTLSRKVSRVEAEAAARTLQLYYVDVSAKDVSDKGSVYGLFHQVAILLSERTVNFPVHKPQPPTPLPCSIL